MERMELGWDAGQGDAGQSEQADEFFEEMEWDQDDAAVPKAKDTGPDPWQTARLGTVKDVAKLFQVHWKTVERWRRKDGLPCVRQGGVIRYALSDVLRWTSARKVGE